MPDLASGNTFFKGVQLFFLIKAFTSLKFVRDRSVVRNRFVVISPFPFLFLKGESREMGFCGNISQSRLRKIFQIGPGSICNTMECILGEIYLQGSSRARVNAENASAFVSNLLLIDKNKEDTILIARHIIWLKHVVGLEEAGSKFCMPSTFLRATNAGESDLDTRECLVELEKRNFVLWEFSATLHKKCRMKDLSPTYISPLDLDSLASPIGSAPSKISQLLVKGKTSYDFLQRAAKVGEVGRRFRKRKRNAEIVNDFVAHDMEQVDTGARVKVEVIEL
ncbi:hypothetical protein KI387_009535 [Taxus chinensis]|uniref:Uncharacterized protein n=1 Tax=Taxus chinensis TaxID=29808 RepID=A0AA38CTD2_TAXCH|nr:hypothetical protein KI387_009535 [Taxus chinensis]